MSWKSSDRQLSFASVDSAAKKKRTKRDLFLVEITTAVPCITLETSIEPHYPKISPNGGAEHFHWASYCGFTACSNSTASQSRAEKALYDIRSLRTFAGLELGRDQIPDETTIWNFRHLLQRHELNKDYVRCDC